MALVPLCGIRFRMVRLSTSDGTARLRRALCSCFCPGSWLGMPQEPDQRGSRNGSQPHPKQNSKSQIAQVVAVSVYGDSCRECYGGYQRAENACRYPHCSPRNPCSPQDQPLQDPSCNAEYSRKQDPGHTIIFIYANGPKCAECQRETQCTCK